MQYDLFLTRQTTYKINPEIMGETLQWIADGCLMPKKWRWSAKVSSKREPVQNNDGYFYRVKIRLSKTSQRTPSADVVKKQIETVLERIKKRASSKKWAVEVADQEATREIPLGAPARKVEKVKSSSPFIFPELNDGAIQKNFSDIYERDAHIRIIHGAIKTTLESEGKVLSHVLMYGLPGACKTRLMERFKEWYEGPNPDVERVVIIDGATMTKAGLELRLVELAKLNQIPDILVIDELEKQPLPNLYCLLNVMTSGAITRLNARAGNIRLPMKCAVVGICNDEEALREFARGALWSRFNHRLYCARPSEEATRKILRKTAFDMGVVDSDVVDKLVEATMHFGWDHLKQRDIRELKGHLDGRERLLTGEWQDDYAFIKRSHDQETN